VLALQWKCNILVIIRPKIFNNSVLSDVTIKQIHNDHVREYHAHKAVFCMESEYSLNMFISNFKVSSRWLKFFGRNLANTSKGVFSKVVELHEDDPEHFEFLLKFKDNLNGSRLTVHQCFHCNTTKSVNVANFRSTRKMWFYCASCGDKMRMSSLVASILG
jgi:hypothetical protein